MAIVQISKIQQRAGNLVDLPQLDNAEFGWAADENRLFIGRTGNTYADENIEVLTSYSNISFNQINGSDGGNFNITTPLNGQILTYVSSTETWENYKGTTAQLNGTKLQLGDVSNLSMTGGAIGYVLQTDGVGNLSWTPKNTLYTTIKGLTNNVTGNIVTMTVANTTPYTNGQSITISGANILNSGANANINGHSFYVKLNVDYPTTGNVVLYTDTGLSVLANGAGLTSYTANTGIATATLGGSGGTGTVGGSNTTVQFNDQNLANGVAGFTFDKTTTTLTVSTGNIVTGNVNANTTITGAVLVSNIATGTAPLTITSTTRVANLSVNYANVSDFEVVTTRTTGTFYPTFVNASTTGNLSLSSNANLSFNAATGALSATLLTGTLTTAAQPNITSTGTLTSLTVTGTTTSGNFATAGNITASFLVSNVANGTAPLTVTSTTVVPNLNVSRANVSDFEVVTTRTTGTFYPTFVNASTTGNLSLSSNANLSFNAATGALSATLFTGTVTTNAQPNITSVGTLTSLAVTGNITNGNVTGGNLVSASFFTGTLTTNAQPNITSVGTLTSLAVTGNITNGNVTGGNLVSASFFTGTLTTNAQPNITSVGTLTSMTSTGNVQGANVIATSYHIRSITTGITAAGTANTTATALTKEINIVSTVVTGANGVALPTAVAGMVLIINNTSANTLNVFPASGAKINALATDASFGHITLASLQYYATSATQWYTVGATYT